jgi:hypothetical protein
MFLGASGGMTPPWLMAALIVSHSAADSQTFSLAVMVALVSPSAIHLAPLLRFNGLMTGLLLSSSRSFDVSLSMRIPDDDCDDVVGFRGKDCRLIIKEFQT